MAEFSASVTSAATASVSTRPTQFNERVVSQVFVSSSFTRESVAGEIASGRYRR